MPKTGIGGASYEDPRRAKTVLRAVGGERGYRNKDIANEKGGHIRLNKIFCK